MIKLYGFEACGPCRQVKRLLEKFEVKYEYIDTLKNKVDVPSVPTLELEDGRRIVGLGTEMSNYIKKLGREHKKKKSSKEKCPQCGRLTINMSEAEPMCDACGWAQ